MSEPSANSSSRRRTSNSTPNPSSADYDSAAWNIINSYFVDNPTALVDHHLTSFDSFLYSGIPTIFKEKNPINISQCYSDKLELYKLKCDMYIGGVNGDRIYYGKPIIYDDERTHYMYPNDARLRNMTYGSTIHYDVILKYTITNDDSTVTSFERIIEKVLLGRLPIMVGSKTCITNSMTAATKFQIGECKNDNGGYFIIDGKERLIIPQEKFADNALYVRNRNDGKYTFSSEIRSAAEDASKPVRTMSVRMVAEGGGYKNGQIVVVIPNVRAPIPLFTLMRALGVRSDKEIVRRCFLEHASDPNLTGMLVPSVHDAGEIFTRDVAVKYIALFTKHKTVASAMEILSDYLLPHIGETNFDDKSFFK